MRRSCDRICKRSFPFEGKLRFPYPGRFGRSIWPVIGRIPGHRTSDSTSFPPESPAHPIPIPRTSATNPDRAQPSRPYKGTTRLSVDAGHEQSPARNLPGLRLRYRFTARVADTPTHTSGTIRLSRHCAADGNSAHSRPDTPIVPVGIPAICACIGVLKFFSEIICS